MYKYMLIALFIGSVPQLAAFENSVGSGQLATASSYYAQTVELAKKHPIISAGVAAIAAFGLYKLIAHVIYREEERIFEDHIQEFEVYVVSRTDYSKICGLINAMEEDLAAFKGQPSGVQKLALTDFDDEAVANGCEGMRGWFCTVYDQCVTEPEGKSFLAEIIKAFRQTVAENMVVAEPSE